MVWLVEILTTASISPEARSATDGGPAAVPAGLAASAGIAKPASANPTAKAPAIRRGARGIKIEALAIGHLLKCPAFDRDRMSLVARERRKPRSTIMLQFGQKSDRNQSRETPAGAFGEDTA